MFFAALTSALSVWPQPKQQKAAWDDRLPGSTWPQTAQRCEVVPRAGGDGVGNTHVDPDGRAGGGANDGRLGGGERDVPATGPILRDPGHTVLPQRAGQPEPDPADLRDMHLRPPANNPPHLDIADAKTFVDPLLAPPGPAMRPRPPITQRLVKIPQGLLPHRRRPRRQPRPRPGLSRLAVTLCSARRRPPTRPPTIRLLQRQVPHKPRIRAMPLAAWRLGKIGAETVTEGHRPRPYKWPVTTTCRATFRQYAETQLPPPEPHRLTRH